jgi:hypothetical protein
MLQREPLAPQALHGPQPLRPLEVAARGTQLYGSKLAASGSGGNGACGSRW